MGGAVCRQFLPTVNSYGGGARVVFFKRRWILAAKQRGLELRSFEIAKQ